MFKMIRMVVALLLVWAPLPALAVVDNGVVPENSAAGHAEAPVLSGPVLAASALMGQPWRLKEFMGAPLPGEPEAPYLLFTEVGDLLGFGGCNYFVGKYRIDEAGKLVVFSMRATHRRCPEAPELEANLLASLLLANSVAVDGNGLAFSMNGNSLMKLAKAPNLPVAELLQQGKLLKVKKTRAHKARSKKKKVVGKSKKPGGKAVPKAPGKKLHDSSKPGPKR